jgi:hypothetical protein
MARASIIGWDMGAALQLGAALAIPPCAMAEMLPAIEAVMVRKMNEAVRSSSVERLDP